MNLVIDANMIIAALIKNGAARQIILSDKFRFVSPDFIFDEIYKHREYICDKSKMDHKDFDLIMLLLFQQIDIIPFDDYRSSIGPASTIMMDDIKDIPYVACCLALKCNGIWTDDSDFQNKAGIKIVDTADLLNELK